MNWETVKEWLAQRSPYIYVIGAAGLVNLAGLTVLLFIQAVPAVLFFFITAFFVILFLLAYKLLFEAPDRIRIILGSLLSGVIFMGGIFILYTLFHNTFGAGGAESEKVVLNDSLGAVFVRNNSPVDEASEFAGREVGVLKTEAKEVRKEAENWIKNGAADVRIVEYNSSEKMAQDLKGAVIDGMIMTESSVAKLQKYEGMEDFLESAKPLYEFKTVPAAQTQSQLQPVNVLFSLTEGYSVPSSGQTAETNLLLTINPSSKILLATLIPGDYLPQAKDGRDSEQTISMISAQSYDQAAEAIGQMLHTTEDSTVFMTYGSLAGTVDSLGGLKVYVDKAFGAGNSYFKEGENEIQGVEAAAFFHDVWPDYEQAATKEKNMLRLLQAFQHALSAQNSPEASVQVILEQSLSNADAAKAVQYLQEMNLNPSDWTYYINSLSGVQESVYLPSAGTVNVIQGTEAAQSHAASSIQAVLNGEQPEYTAF